MKGNLAHLAVISDGREYARVPQTYCMRMRMWGGGVGFGHKSCDFDVKVAFFFKKLHLATLSKCDLLSLQCEKVSKNGNWVTKKLSEDMASANASANGVNGLVVFHETGI